MATYQHDNYPQVTPQECLHLVEPPGKEAWAHEQPYVAPQYTPNDKAARQIKGLSPRAFWLVIALISILVVAASVGGAVGGTRGGKSQGSCSPQTSTTQASASATSPTSASTASRSSTTSTPTPLPLSQRITTDCPASNGTIYTPNDTRDGSPGSQRFLKRCLSDSDGENLMSGMVIDFDNCMALCANWNIWQPNGPKCTYATFRFDGIPPGNCWAKNGTKFAPSGSGNEDVGMLL